MKVLLIITILFTNSFLVAQQTVGLFSNTIDSYNGYTLFAPMVSNNTYLIDNCGEQVHSWASAYNPGLSAYLLEDGTLLRTRNTNSSTFTAGGSGGGIEMLDWNGNVIWEYTISTTLECHHHDIEYLPNGNILAIIWDSKTSAEATQAGRTTSGTTLWSEKIIEIQPDLVNGGGIIVWEWYAWDHLVQDADNTKDNYGVVSISPELINLNYYSGNPTSEDWLHFNSIDYNAEFDQIVISGHSFSEVWILDHSTTTLEAASHLGGTYNKGGDLLYRWGNPQAYDQGTSTDQLLYSQHDAYWIEDSLTDGGMIMVLNNKAGSPTDYTEVNIIDPPVDVNGNYTYSGTAYAPSAFHWTYQAATPTDFYATNISGSQRLPDGNTLICEGTTGRLFEVDYSGNTVWEYISPVSMSGPVTQGNSATPNVVFRCTRYSVDYPGLAGQTLTPQGYIESGSTFTCDLYPSGINEKNVNLINIYPNPTSDILNIEAGNFQITSLVIYDVAGKVVVNLASDKINTQIDISEFKNGLYYVLISTTSGKIEIDKLIKI